MSNEELDDDDTRPEADEDQDDGATPAEFIDTPENLPGEPDDQVEPR